MIFFSFFSELCDFTSAHNSGSPVKRERLCSLKVICQRTQVGGRGGEGTGRYPWQPKMRPESKP